MQITLIIRSFLTFLMMLPANNQASTVYRWVDDQGLVHFSETKPANDRYDKLKIKNTPSSDADEARAEREAKRGAAASTTATSKSDKPAPDQPELEAKLKQDCDRLKRNLEILRSGVPVRSKTDDGQYGDYLDDTQRTQSIQENEAYVNVFCK